LKKKILLLPLRLLGPLDNCRTALVDYHIKIQSCAVAMVKLISKFLRLHAPSYR